jgi:hypothetical protein
MANNIKFNVGDNYNYGDKTTTDDPFVITEIIGTLIRVQYLNDKCNAYILESTFKDKLLKGIYKFVDTTKPLDKAFQSMGETPLVVACKHKNIKHDTWFTSKVYSHCADCGVAL